MKQIKKQISTKQTSLPVYFDIKQLQNEKNIFDNIKKLIKRGKEVVFVLDKYKIHFAKSKFLIFKENKLILQNCFISYEYNLDTKRLIINPDTDKKVVVYIPLYGESYKEFEEFLWYYRDISYDNKVLKRDCANEIPAILSLLNSTFLILFYLILLFGTIAILMFATAHLEIFENHQTVRIWISRFFALVIAEVVYGLLSDYFK